jgi:hypothetical protein
MAVYQCSCRGDDGNEKKKVYKCMQNRTVKGKEAKGEREKNQEGVEQRFNLLYIGFSTNI